MHELLCRDGRFYEISCRSITDYKFIASSTTKGPNDCYFAIPIFHYLHIFCLEIRQTASRMSSTSNVVSVRSLIGLKLPWFSNRRLLIVNFSKDKPTNPSCSVKNQMLLNYQIVFWMNGYKFCIRIGSMQKLDRDMPNLFTQIRLKHTILIS